MRGGYIQGAQPFILKGSAAFRSDRLKPRVPPALVPSSRPDKTVSASQTRPVVRRQDEAGEKPARALDVAALATVVDPVLSVGRGDPPTPDAVDDTASRVIRGSLVGLLGVGLGIITAVATVPLLLRWWNEPTYAVWLAVFAFYLLLQTFDSGYTTYLGNEFLRQAHEDSRAYATAFASGLRVAIMVGAVQLVACLAILAFGLVPRVLGLPANDPAAHDAGLALLALSVAWWLSAPVGGVLAGLYYPAGLFVRAQWWAIANKLLLFLALVVPVACGGGIVAVALTISAGSILYTIVFSLDAVRHIPVARQWGAQASLRESLVGIRRSLGVTGNNAVQQLSTSGLALAVASIFGALALPVFTTLRTLANAAAAVATVAVNPMVPDMVRYQVHGQWQKLRASFEACWFGVGAAVQFGLLVTFPYVDVVYATWTHGRMQFDAPLYALLGWSIGVAALGAPALRYLQAMNRLRAQTVANVLYLVGLAAVLPLGALGLGLPTVGVAIVVAEAARTVLVLRYVHAEAPAAEGRQLVREALFASVPLLLTGLALSMSLYQPAHRFGFSMGGALLLIPAYLALWRTLDPELRFRARQMLRRRAKLDPCIES